MTFSLVGGLTICTELVTSSVLCCEVNETSSTVSFPEYTFDLCIRLLIRRQIWPSQVLRIICLTDSPCCTTFRPTHCWCTICNLTWSPVSRLCGCRVRELTYIICSSLCFFNSSLTPSTILGFRSSSVCGSSVLVSPLKSRWEPKLFLGVLL